MFDKKPLPRPSLSLVLHPEDDPAYQHFEDALNVPFQTVAGTFSRINAWWLADAALLSYWPPDAARRIFNDQAHLESESVQRLDTQAHVAWNDAFALVAFRGTAAGFADRRAGRRTNRAQGMGRARRARACRVQGRARGRLGSHRRDPDPARQPAGLVHGTQPRRGAGDARRRPVRARAAEPRLRRARRHLHLRIAARRRSGFVDGFNTRCGDRSFRFVNDQDTVSACRRQASATGTSTANASSASGIPTSSSVNR